MPSAAPREASSMASDDELVTSEDIEELNRLSVARAAAFTRMGGAVLLAMSALGLVGWLWVVIRTQQQSALFRFGNPGGSPDLLDRVSLLTTSLDGLLTSVLVGGVGLVMRLLADLAQTLTGGTVTGFQVGDVIPSAVVMEVVLEPDA